MNRRSFLHIGTTVVSSSIIKPISAITKPENASIVYEAHNAKMISGDKPDRTKVDENYVKASLEGIIKAMVDENDIGKALELLLSGITKQSKIAIKINLLRQYNGPQYATLKALVHGLTSMFNGSYPASNISVFDRYSNDANKQYGSEQLDKLGVWYGTVDYQGDEIEVAGRKMYIATVFSEADYGINMVASRKHQFYAGFLSGVIKNMMGALSTERAKYATLRAHTGGEFHDNENYQAFIDMFKHYFRDKLHIYIADHILIPEHEGKTYYSKIANKILIGTDPCAVDARTVDILKHTFPLQEKKPTTKVPAALANAGIGTIAYNVYPVS